MSASTDFGSAMLEWANRTPAIQGLVLIGSRARGPSQNPDRPDALSDWDFHVIVSEPGIFYRPDWTRELAGVEVLAYAVRTTMIGGVPKITAVFDCGEVDLVLIPVSMLRSLRWRTRLGWHRKPSWSRRRITELSEVLGHGWRFLKDTGNWAKFYGVAEQAVPYPWMDDAQVRQLAEAFVCEYVSARAKLARGEYRTVFRTLTLELMETNFRLLHELRGRRKEKTYRQVRRIERIASAAEVEAVSVRAVPEKDSLAAALEKSAATCRELMQGLVGGAWRWPDLTLPGD